MTADTHLPEVVSPEEWLAARRELLAKENPSTDSPPSVCDGSPN
jgi:predicted dithiol-disulfide oxidoreductase (DUF899 family)